MRFSSCRWQQPKEEGNAAFCTHREVKPYAGTTGFDADAWCPDCQYYKLRRAPKKRNPTTTATDGFTLSLTLTSTPSLNPRTPAPGATHSPFGASC